MTQEETWMKKYEEIVSFIQTNHRNPSRYDDEERGKYCNWLKHNRKLLKAGKLKEDRIEMFTLLLSKMEEYKHKNQYE